MRKAVLLGNPGTKRTYYLMKAAAQEGISVHFLNWKDWREHLPEAELFLKIDPPLWDSCFLGDLNGLAETYIKDLKVLEQWTAKMPAVYLNTPSSIVRLMDKRGCKAVLKKAGLPVTELLDPDAEDFQTGGYRAEKCPERSDGIRDLEGLLDRMKKRNVYQVFIKPVCGSGAAGVSAFRLQPGTGRMSLYTCAAYVPDAGLMNTKKLRNYTEVSEIRQLLNKILDMDCVIERWYAKAVYGQYSYDLRVVVQEGRTDYMLARLSGGPITNLHLNNHPLSWEETGISSDVREKIQELCVRAVSCFPGLSVAGIDILLERKSLKPRIIEMNAQGDLIYQDIYHENTIYRRQAEKMKAWLSV